MTRLSKTGIRLTANRILRGGTTLAVICAGASLAVALVAPYVGLGADERFIGWRLFGVRRIALAIGGTFTIALVLVCKALLWGVRTIRTDWRTPKNPLSVVRLLASLCVVTALTATAVAETIRRTTIPFIGTQWPTRFSPEFGTTFQPGGQVRWTNHIDYWNVSKANRLGFLDDEPRSGHDERCLVAFIGDSYLEAAQLPIAAKIHRLFEARAATLRTKRIDTVAFGYSGTGQTSQLFYYDTFVRDLRPDVVVLVVSNNDFANNSLLLEAIRNGWHPSQPPAPFFVKSSDGSMTLEPAYFSTTRRPLIRANGQIDDRFRRLNELLVQHSGAYAWLTTTFRSYGWSLTPEDALIAARMQAVAADVEWAQALEDWRYPNDLDMDEMFYADPMPEVFESAVASTAAAFEAFVTRVQKDRVELLVLASQGVSRRFGEGDVRFGRRMIDRGYYRRLEKLLNDRNVPVIDQGAFLASREISEVMVRWPHDGHWNALGHETAADALITHFAEHSSLCASDRSRRNLAD